jgi:hypothetical protein
MQEVVLIIMKNFGKLLCTIVIKSLLLFVKLDITYVQVMCVKMMKVTVRKCKLIYTNIDYFRTSCTSKQFYFQKHNFIMN